METLMTVFKSLLLVAGSLVLLFVIVSIIKTPFEAAARRKKQKLIHEKLQKALAELKEEVEKQEKQPTKKTVKPRKTKKKEEK